MDSVGFLLPSQCWKGSLSYAACCTGPESPCWTGFSGAYEACCLFKKLPDEDVALRLGPVSFNVREGSRGVMDPPLAEVYRRTGLAWSVNEHVFQAAASTWLAASHVQSCLDDCEAAKATLEATETASLLILELAGRRLVSLAQRLRGAVAVEELLSWTAPPPLPAACELPAVPGLGLEEILRQHRGYVDGLVSEAFEAMRSSVGDDVTVDVDRFFDSSKLLANANVALVSQLHFLCHAPENLTQAVRFDRNCCRFWHLVEAACQQIFLKTQSHVQVVELGVRFGWLSHYLLSRYDWIHLVGVDLLLSDYGLSNASARELQLRLAFGKRVRLLVPMDTTSASRQLDTQIDVLILDARFSEEGMLEDLRNYLPLMKPGGQVLARWGLDIMLQLHEQGGYAGRRLRDFRIGSVWDGLSYAIQVD